MRGLNFAINLALVGTLFSCQQSGTPKGAAGAPTFKYVEKKAGGCGDLFFYKATADDLEVLWISVDKKKLKVPGKGSSTFDLEKAPDGLSVAIDIWQSAPRFRAYCNDISPGTQKKAVWKAKKGKLVITLLGPADPADPGSMRYKASARLENVVFDDGAGNQATLKDETIEAVVGWYAG